MQIMIDIPKEEYERLAYIDILKLRTYIENGVPLPKGHGRLIDADALWKKWVFDAIGKQEIDNAPTIIEAERG